MIYYFCNKQQGRFNFHSVLFRHWEGAAVVVRKECRRSVTRRPYYLSGLSPAAALIMMVIDYERALELEAERAFGGRQGSTFSVHPLVLSWLGVPVGPQGRPSTPCNFSTRRSDISDRA